MFITSWDVRLLRNAVIPKRANGPEERLAGAADAVSFGERRGVSFSSLFGAVLLFSVRPSSPTHPFPPSPYYAGPGSVRSGRCEPGVSIASIGRQGSERATSFPPTTLSVERACCPRRSYRRPASACSFNTERVLPSEFHGGNVRIRPLTSSGALDAGMFRMQIRCPFVVVDFFVLFFFFTHASSTRVSFGFLRA